MIKKRFRIFASIMAVMLTFLCFHGCSSNKSSDGYVTAKVTNTISSLKNMVAWTDGGRFFIEKDGVVKSNYDYDLGGKEQYYSDITLIGDYLYYIGGVDTGIKPELYIARINHTEEKPEVEKLTEPKRRIFSYAVLGNKLYYIAWEGENVGTIAKNNMYLKNLSGKKEKVLIDDWGVDFEFCTNGSKFIVGNKIFDIKTKKNQAISEKWMAILGVYNNYYYFYSGSDSDDMNECDFKRMNLKDNSIETLFTLTDFGLNEPRMSDNKILFLETELGTYALKYKYYDILKNEMVTVMDSTDTLSRYTYDDWDRVSDYNNIISNNYFYVYYPKLMTCVNMSTNKEEIFTWGPGGSGKSGLKYGWCSYEEYLQKQAEK